jgi:disulfide bond formation protein DsbB
MSPHPISRDPSTVAQNSIKAHSSSRSTTPAFLMEEIMSTRLTGLNRSLSRLSLVALLSAAMLFAGACTQPPEGGPPPSDANQPAQNDAENEEPEAAEAEAPEAVSLGDAAHGEELYVACAACHGMDARGVQGLGKDLHNNEFMANMSDDEIVTFLKTGRSASHELNSTGVDMPPKGGNPALSDEDLLDIVAYMRTLE